MNVPVLLGVFALFSICHADVKEIEDCEKEFNDKWNVDVQKCVEKKVNRSTVETAVKSCCETVAEKKFLPTCICIMDKGQKVLDECNAEIDLKKFAMKMQSAIKDIDFDKCTPGAAPEDKPCFVYELYQTLKEKLESGGSCEDFTKEVMNALEKICITYKGDLKDKLCSIIGGV